MKLRCKCSILSLLFLSLASPGIDTIIIVLSGTKQGSKSHNNRCVSFHGRDLLSDTGQNETLGGIQVSRDNDVLLNDT